MLGTAEAETNKGGYRSCLVIGFLISYIAPNRVEEAVDD